MLMCFLKNVVRVCVRENHNISWFCSFNSCSEGHLALMLQQPVAVHTPPGPVCTSRTASESEQTPTGNKRADIWHEWVHNDLFDLSVSLWFSELSEEMAQCWVYELAHLVHSAWSTGIEVMCPLWTKKKTKSLLKMRTYQIFFPLNFRPNSCEACAGSSSACDLSV